MKTNNIRLESVGVCSVHARFAISYKGNTTPTLPFWPWYYRAQLHFIESLSSSTPFQRATLHLI